MKMRKKYFYIGILVLTLLIFIVPKYSMGEVVLNNFAVADIDKLEIYHFHGTQQCPSCKAIGAYAEETANTYFADELNSGKIIFEHVNIDLPENKDLVIKYGASGSSLWLGVYSGEKFSAEENINVWYKIKNKQDYMTYLKGVIEQKLAGE